MRQLLLCAIVMACFISVSYGQWRVGPELGLGYTGNAKIYSSGVTGFELPSKIRIGFSLESAFSKHWAAQTGLFYAGKGIQGYPITVLKIDHFDSTRRYISSRKPDIRFGYLELPLNIVFKTGDGSKARLIAGAGIYASYALSVHVDTASVTLFTDSTLNSPTANRSENIKKADFGFNVFAGVEFPFGLQLKIYYSQGLSTLLSGDEKIRNKTYGLAACYLFNLCKKKG